MNVNVSNYSKAQETEREMIRESSKLVLKTVVWLHMLKSVIVSEERLDEEVEEDCTCCRDEIEGRETSRRKADRKARRRRRK